MTCTNGKYAEKMQRSRAKDPVSNDLNTTP